MDIHSPKILGQGTAERAPTDPYDIVNLAALNNAVAGALTITSIVPQNQSGNNLVGLPAYLENTIPADSYLATVTTNVADVRVHFSVEPLPGERYVEVTATYNDADEPKSSVVADVANMTVDPDYPGQFLGYVDLTLDELKTSDIITLTASTGSTYAVSVAILIGGPEVTQATLGALPNGQTALKQGDEITVSGVVDNTAVSIKALNAGIAGSVTNLTLGAEDSAGAGFKTFTGTITVSNRTGSQTVSIVATNLLGTEGDAFESDAATLDQTYPTIGNASYTYPAGQEAIKGSETVDVDVTVTNADEYNYSVATGLAVSDPANYSQTKTITRNSEDITYSVNANLYTIEATRTSNGAVSTKSFVVKVVAVAPSAQLSIVGNPSRLRSSNAGQTYQVQVTPNQPLLEAPSSLDLAVNAGTFSGSWSASGNNYRRQFLVTDIHARGTHQFTNLEITGLSGLTSTVISSGEDYTIGGFTFRQLTVPAFSQLVEIGTYVADINKVEVSYSGADVLALQNSTANVAKGFTVTDDQGNYDPNGNYIFITDQAFAGSNTSGTLLLDVEETV